jgi:hypothetical protein
VYLVISQSEFRHYSENVSENAYRKNFLASGTFSNSENPEYLWQLEIRNEFTYIPLTLF